MEKIDFVNNSTPALNARNLNKLQDNIEDAIGESGGVTVRTEETISDTETYSCNFTNGKFDKTSVKTSTTSSDTDTYSCNYIDDSLSNKLNTSAVKIAKTTSNSDTYCCTYINDLTDAEDYTITPSYSTYSPTYTLKKIGHLVFLNCNSIYLASINANAWSDLATIPDALKPSISLTTVAVMANGNNGNITGYGRCELQETGTIRVKMNVGLSSLAFFTFTLVWTV